MPGEEGTASPWGPRGPPPAAGPSGEPRPSLPFPSQRLYSRQGRTPSPCRLREAERSQPAHGGAERPRPAPAPAGLGKVTKGRGDGEEEEEEKWRCPRRRAALWTDGASLQEEPAGRERRRNRRVPACVPRCCCL